MGTNKVLIEGSSISAPQMSEFWKQVGTGAINSTLFQMFLDHQLEFNLARVTIDWVRVYKALDMKFEPGELATEADPLYWDVYVQKGVTPNKVIAAFRQLGVDVYTYVDDLDGCVSTNDRTPTDGSYRVRFCKTVEADPKLANKSAEDLKVEKIVGITLLERLLLGLGYFLATGSHLDIENVTLCSGSRNSDGLVPGVYWSAYSRRELYVDWCSVQCRDSYLRSRAVVS